MPRHGASLETVSGTLETGEECSEETGNQSDKKSDIGNQYDEESEDSRGHTHKNGTVFPNMSRAWEMGEDDSGEGMGLWASSFDMRNVVVCIWAIELEGLLSALQQDEVFCKCQESE